MAKIVEPPKPKQVRCNACKALIEYLPEEVKKRSWDLGDYGGSEEYIKCPRESEKGRCPGEGIISKY